MSNKHPRLVTLGPGNGHDTEPTPESTASPLDLTRPENIEAAVTHILQEIVELREQGSRRDRETQSTREAAESAEATSIDLLETMRRLERDVRGSLFESRADRDRLRKATEATDGLCNDVLKGLVAVDTKIGSPPIPLDRMSKVGEHTAEELAAMQHGSGLMGLVGRLIVGQTNMAKVVAKAAGWRAGASASVTALTGTAPVWGPVAVDVLRTLFGG